ncbi:protein FAR1-RELATED SEQUENCE 9-like [Asparagus officinalis]|uniref:protein FAR1-RELATED SEQUENCE 9-like n=1 Tax=Asparagus officinalis TaxID=4686 RepID=UPI00098DF479|nr:protein FAR1-RELATED SEQUENCE 9-like [Asparagus officinalis]
MKEKFDINEEGDGWLQTVYKYREHWVSCYLKDTFFAGMRSSQRSESINAFFDGEAHEDYKSLNTKPVILLGHPIEVQVGEMYTRNMFDVFQTEFKGFGIEFCEELRKDGDIVEYKICKFADRGKWETNFFITRSLHPTPLDYTCSTSNIGVGNIVFGRNLTSCEEKINLLKSWALRAKFNNALELAFDSEERMQKLDNVLTKFIESLEEEVREIEDNPQISAPISYTMEHISQITVRDPKKSARTKGRPRNVRAIIDICKLGRLQAGYEMVTMFGMSEIGPWALMDPVVQSSDVVMRMLARNSMSEKLGH